MATGEEEFGAPGGRASVGPGRPEKEIRVALLLRICPEYRVNFVRRLSKVEGLSLRLYLGEDPLKGKVFNAKDLSGIDVRRFPTTWIKAPVMPLPVHWGLGRALEEHAKALTKPVEDLTSQERSRAFCSYILSGRHLEDK